MELQATVKFLRDARRQLRPGFIRPGHLCRLPLRSRWTTGTMPTPATAATVLRLRDYGRHHGLLRVRHPGGNRLRRTTGTTGAPFPARLPTTAPSVLRLRLSNGDAAEQGLDRRA